MIGLTPDRKFRYLSDAQAQYIADLIEARFAADAPERESLRTQFRAIRTHGDVSAMIEGLKAIPTLALRERQAAEQARSAEEKRIRDSRPTAEGMYRNPATGELYRLRYDAKSYGMAVSKYSETGGPRRLVASTGDIVKGKWHRLTTFNSRLLLARGEIDKDWLIDPKELAREFAYGFCPLHNGPLQDAVSVVLGYGPDCAEKHGLPWSEEAAQAVLAARTATSEEN